LERAQWRSKPEKAALAFMERRYGVNLRDAASLKERFPILESNFSWSKTMDRLMEADDSSLFPQVLRSGVQTIANAMYKSVETTFEEWCQVVNTSRREELYAPLHGVGFPSEVGEKQKFPQVGADGLDLKIRNRKYGTTFPISLELAEDDQTGQFRQQAGLLGQYARQILELLAYGKLASLAGGTRYANLTVRASETKPSDEATYPWVGGASSLRGGAKTKLSANVAMTVANLQTANIQLMNQLNLLGLKMSASGRRVLVSPFYSYDIKQILNSSYYPAGAQAAGVTGGAFSDNVLKGAFQPTIGRFMPDHLGSTNSNSKAWYLVDDSVPWFVVQIREAASVTMENPQSGESFDRDVARFKVRIRANADHIDPRFAIQGSDGSV
jgi:hypothetical protein